jgi:hypothetical protein
LGFIKTTKTLNSLVSTIVKLKGIFIVRINEKK